jgi:hypothetical protein
LKDTIDVVLADPEALSNKLPRNDGLAYEHVS